MRLFFSAEVSFRRVSERIASPRPGGRSTVCERSAEAACCFRTVSRLWDKKEVEEKARTEVSQGRCRRTLELERVGALKEAFLAPGTERITCRFVPVPTLFETSPIRVVSPCAYLRCSDVKLAGNSRTEEDRGGIWAERVVSVPPRRSMPAPFPAPGSSSSANSSSLVESQALKSAETLASRSASRPCGRFPPPRLPPAILRGR